MQPRFWTWFVPLILIAVVGFVFLDAAFPGALATRDSQIRLVYGIGLLALVGGSVVLGWRRQPAMALNHAIIWAGIFVGLLVVYVYRAELGQVASRVGFELTPTRPMTSESGEVRIRSNIDGHFVVMADVNRVPVKLLVDTGASLVVLTLSDAARLGIDVDDLTFNMPLSTANGRNFGARVTLSEISVGDVLVTNVGAIVLPDGLDMSLLGMSFLRRLSSYEVNRNELIIRR